MKNRMSIVAVGTELVSGEVVNSNAATISTVLGELGGELVQHLAVPDQISLMTEALDYVARSTDWIFVTGGLGPTSDDITRQVLAHWIDKELEFNEEIWSQLQKTYSERGLQLRHSHRQQCYFPQGSEILKNPSGTAQGFLVKKDELTLVALPGPPREIQSIFEAGLTDIIRSQNFAKEKKLLSWKCLGVPESDAAERLEKVLKPHNVEIGYRANMPYVICKVWCLEEQAEEIEEVVEQAIGQWVVGRQQDDLLHEWMLMLQELPSVPVFDRATGGRLAERIRVWCHKNSNLRCPIELMTSWQDEGEIPFAPVRFSINPDSKNSFYKLSVQSAGRSHDHTIELPYRLEHGSDRAQLFLCEEALFQWLSFTQENESLFRSAKT